MNAISEAPSPVVSAQRELVLAPRDFHRIRELIYRHAGIVLAEHKREMVYGRLARRVRALQLHCFGDYVDRLEAHPADAEWQHFINALTTNLTAFFREPHHFPLLARHVAGRRDRVRVWCAAASTGEEPYSIAITLREALGEQVPFEVLATDIDTDALARARQGVYRLEQLGKVDAERLRRNFLRGSGGMAGYARVRPEVAQHVSFSPLNLVAGRWPVEGPFDAIFTRNVMIYFDQSTQARILERLAPLLKPDGLLFAGHSESFSYVSERFRLRGQTVYTRAG
ncbi:CheR family methyltransferase [Parahaliea mediterranea]|uniref:CheR family methyltransferase n=1 Tax=Parahaliea mediterranea TaxID=651086 RepID=UPI0019D4D9BF|nr:CheR family methyltransferase [Parahaliea mediterranea]